MNVANGLRTTAGCTCFAVFSTLGRYRYTSVGHHTDTQKHDARRHPSRNACVFEMPVRILIADDNPVVRTALRHLLESVGHWEIIDVENGLEAIAQAQEFRPNLIILDLVMPVMDGLTAARAGPTSYVLIRLGNSEFALGMGC